MASLITPDDRIVVAGHRGMAGSAICRALKGAGYHQILTATRQELDLLNPLAVHGWFELIKPTVVVLGWRARIPLAEGLVATVADFRQSLSNGEVRLS